jgi:quercetin dioxygenase-like cupin family protein
MSDAQSTEHIDDDGARVTQWTFATAGVATGVHTHEFDYIIVPVTGGDFEVVADDGTTTRMTQVAGVAYGGPAGTRHNVVSAGPDPIVFVEVELKP